MGIPSRVAPPILMHEIYELCREDNKFLTYENAQKFTEGLENDENDSQADVNRSTPNRMASHARQQNTKKKKPKKVFKDVPKEDLLKLSDNMKVFLIGQDQAVNDIAEAVQRASVGLKDPVRPIGSFLFAGRTGIGKCTEKGTLIFSEDGIKPIDSFCAGNKISELSMDVYGINGVNRTSHIYKEGIKPGRRIVTDSGYELGGSLIHPVVSLNGSGYPEFKRFFDLTTDDYVAIQYNQNYFSATNKKINFDFIKKVHDNSSIIHKLPEEINEDLAYYIGLLTGDGGLTTDGVIGFTNKDKQLVRKFFELSKNLFGATPKYDSSKYGYTIHSIQIYNFLKDGCGITMCKSTHKEIPSIILESTKECIKSFIVGLMDTDGYFEKHGGVVGITLSTKKLINQLQTVLLNFGIVSSIRHRLVRYNGDFNNAWELTVRGKYAKRFFVEIGFSLNYKKDKYNLIYLKNNNPNKDVIPNIHNVIHDLVSAYRLNRKFHRNYRGYYKGYRKPSRKKLIEILNVMHSLVGKEIESNSLYLYLCSLSLADIFWSKIAKIDYVDEMDLYDFTVPKTHTFTSNGFISHNTLAAKVLADELIRDRDNLITIDCSEYSADHEYAKLIGSPQGYIGFEQGGYLTNAVMKSPFSVVVFDEVEKASTKVHELLLQILEEGRLTDGKGQQVSFKDTIVIMTSNVGVGEVDAISKTIGFGDVAKITDAKKDKAIDEAIKGKFKPEFINRIDSIIKFKGLSKDDYMRIIDIELYKLNDNLKNNDTEYKGLTLKFDSKIKKLIYDLGINEDFGARPLKRCIEKEVATPIAMRLLKENTDPDSLVTVSVRNKKATFKINKKPEELFVSDEHKEMATLNTSLPK
jgi:intein/homing endonuclease